MVQQQPRERYLSTVELCRVAGCTYRQADYWARSGVLVPSRPARGSGNVRGWSVQEACLARAFAVLAGFHADLEVFAGLVFNLRDQPWLWDRAVLFNAVGNPIQVGDGYRIDLAACRAHVLACLSADPGLRGCLAG